MQIVVTGGAGFLGSHLCDKLIKNENKVICLDNFSTGKKKNIFHLLKNKNFTLINHDIQTPYNLDNIDQIYNLACPASPFQYQNNPIETTLTSIIGSLNMLNLAKKNNARILQASTSEVYGNPLEHPQTESYQGNVNPIGVRSCYDEGKRCAESLFFDFYRKYSLDIKIVRIFNTYGDRMSRDDGRVMSNFICQALSNKDLTIYGNGDQSRSFCFVNDLIDAMYMFMNLKDKYVGPLNIGNPEEISIIDLAKKIIKLTDSSSSITNLPANKDDPFKRKPNINLALQLLKEWKINYSLEYGINKTISYFRSL